MSHLTILFITYVYAPDTSDKTHTLKKDKVTQHKTNPNTVIFNENALLWEGVELTTLGRPVYTSQTELLRQLS